MDNCVGLFGKIFGHKFKARFDEETSEGKWPFTEGTIESQIAGTQGNESKACLISTTKSEKVTYLYDICVRCGKVIKRNE